MQERTIQHIAEDAQIAGISIADLCRHAEYATKNFHEAVSGRQLPRAATIRRLDIGLARAKTSKKAEIGFAERNVFLLCIYAVANFTNVAPETILSHDPGKRATSDPQWLAASKLRRLALYVASVATGMSQAEVARAAGMTRAAVCIALKAIEDDRDDIQLDAFLSKIERVFSS